MQAEDLQLGALGDLRGAFDGHLLRENRGNKVVLVKGVHSPKNLKP